MTCRTSFATRATVGVVSLGVDTLVGANCEAGSTAQFAGSRLTGLSSCTGFVASTTVLEVGLKVVASISALGLTRGTRERACTAEAEFSRLASVVASATVL